MNSIRPGARAITVGLRPKVALKPGGRVVYATCSILAEENEGVVSAFLAGNPEFSLVPAEAVLATQHVTLATPDGYLRLDPQQHSCDGFFAAVLERQAG